MLSTVADIKREAERRFGENRPLEALKAYRLVLEALPSDFDNRLRIGDVLANLAAPRRAQKVFEAVATFDMRTGNPLRAMVALKRLEQVGGNSSLVGRLLVERYCSQSGAVGRGLKPVPPDDQLYVREGIDVDFDIPRDRLIRETATMASDLSILHGDPLVVPPVPIFSQLDADAFASLLAVLVLRRYEPGDEIIAQGTAGDAVYFLARGEVSAVRAEAGGDEPREPVRTLLARLGEGSLFGEMALVSNEARSASVICDTPVDALELSASNAGDLGKRIPQIEDAMSRFAQERMIGNLLATHPLFEPFDEDSRKGLLSRFTGHQVPAGTTFLEEGAVGPGLYLILRGDAEVLKWDGEKHIELARLGPADVAGEISVLHEEPVSATVRTTTDSTLLFLARELFTPLVDAVPDLLAHFNRLAETRKADTELKLKKVDAASGDDGEEFECLDDLVDDDQLLI